MIYIVMIDAFTVLFRITGMPKEKARFQVISLLTNSGYTTSESEVVVKVLARRKMAKFVMLFGYIFSVTIISLFVNMMVSLTAYEAQEIWPSLVTLSVIFIAFLLVKRIPKIHLAFNDKIESWGRKLIYGKKDNAIVLLDEFTRGVFAKVLLTKMPLGMEGKTVDEYGQQHGLDINLVFVERGNEILKNAHQDIILQEGDVLAVFGKQSDIERAFAHANNAEQDAGL